ncbi:glycoside hydrolase family 5 protein [candidate division CSSED10-310 bacterium]|uniref:Glycoside hydrolase family 5 protein n=1 Tax=candidate division CSSED10-310 bacterium TaxID=2855610 RepID=A0ABV6Z2I9_UNCC1
MTSRGTEAQEGLRMGAKTVAVPRALETMEMLNMNSVVTLRVTVSSLCWVMLLSLVMLTCSPADDDAEKVVLPWLTVRNGQIVEANSGRTVILRGTNIDMFYYFEPDYGHFIWNHIDEWALDSYRAAGANHVRLCFHWMTLAESDPVRLRTENLEKYKEIVDMCTARGMYVLLDMHVPPGNEEIDPILGQFWTDPQNTADFLEIWSLLALEFTDNPGILGYDLFNEPSPPAEEDWWDLVDQAVLTIRAVDKRHIIVVEPPLVEYDQPFRIVEDPQILYSFHFYEPFAVTHRAADWCGDTSLPTTAEYPGSSLVDMDVLGLAAPSSTITGTEPWTELWTETTVPVEAGYATIIAYAENGAVDVFFDDFSVIKNGQPVDLVNPHLSRASYFRTGLPRAWFTAIEGGYSCVWDRNTGCLEPGSLHISGSGERALWHQYEWALLTAPLIAVRPGDSLTVRAMVSSAGSSGYGAVSLAFLKPIYIDYNREFLRNFVEQEVIHWLTNNNVPGHVGEFGSMARENDPSATALIRDMASIWNEFNLHWTLWTGRDTAAADHFGFGIIHCPVERFPRECQTFRQSVYTPWRESLAD